MKKDYVKAVTNLCELTENNLPLILFCELLIQGCDAETAFWDVHNKTIDCMSKKLQTAANKYRESHG
jgi:hypothetical protein